MKRILIAILCVLYMASATGATVHLHYCMGRLIEASLAHSDEDKCSNCGMKKGKPNDCCKDVHKTIKASESHLLAKSKTAISFSAFTLPKKVYIERPATVCTQELYTASSANAPPDLFKDCPLYIRLRNLRI